MGLFEDLSKFNRRQEAVISAFSRIGYKVVPRKGKPCINRDLKVVYMPVVDPAKYPDILRTIRGWTDHEMAHELYKSDMAILKKAIGQGKKFEDIFRYIEDGRVERLESQDFEGCRENLLYGEKECLADRKKMGLTLYLAGKYGVAGVKLYKMDEWGAIVGADIVEKCHKIETCQDAYDVAQEAYARIQKYIEDAVTSEMMEEASEEEAEQHPTVSKSGPDDKKEKKESKPREQDEILQDDDDKPEPKESKEEKDEGSEKSESKEKGEEAEDNSGDKDDADDDSKSDEKNSDAGNDRDSDAGPEGEKGKAEVAEDDEAEGDEEGSEEGEEGDNEDEGDDSSEPATDSGADKDSSESGKEVEGETKGNPSDTLDKAELEARIKAMMDDMVSDKDLMENLLEKLREEMSKIPYDPRTYTPYTADDEVHDLTKEDLSGIYNREWFPACIAEAKSKVNALAQKLRLELFATKMLFERYKDRGRLDQRRLHVLGMGTTADVFMKRTELPEIDTAISLLVDASGSMDMDNKIGLAAQVAYLLSSTMETINIPHEVLSFTTKSGNFVPGYDRSTPLVHYIHKSFSTRLIHCMEAMNRIGCATYANTDGESVLWAAARLATRKEKRRVLFVLSDGQPANGTSESYKLYEHLKDVVKMVSKHGIECVGIGIMTDCVKQFYPNNVVVNNLDDLVTTAYGEIVKAIRGARREVR